MTPIEAVRSALGEPFKSEAKCREVVRAVLLAVRGPSAAALDAGRAAGPIILVEREVGRPYARTMLAEEVREAFAALLDALLVEVEKG